MYHWIEDKEFLGRMRKLCCGIVNELVQSINNSGELLVSAHMVGSGARHLETQNANGPVDLDFNLNIEEVRKPGLIPNERALKSYVQQMFDDILDLYDLSHCQDSTSALTTSEIRFKKGNRTPFHIDLAIVREGSFGSWERLIHQKTGVVAFDRWFWNTVPGSQDLTRKAERLKEDDHWLEVRETYLDRKNLYLGRNDHDHPSFICYIEAVNEVYNQYYNQRYL